MTCDDDSQEDVGELLNGHGRLARNVISVLREAADERQNSVVASGSHRKVGDDIGGDFLEAVVRRLKRLKWSWRLLRRHLGLLADDTCAAETLNVTTHTNPPISIT